ncbi:hypothetical protein TIFTF001_045444 [Ficus carica]|uniref:Uncharacterized protein n=1 Tax=Ficus carica TaxID=3494 RepID=A0AA87Z8H4_FICCA|nr:hypothetical protein TIFTF001_045443 [Ficus carica]GMN21148.1 hypothetical protein TIFTF001_045444 [Ficus carica]
MCRRAALSATVLTGRDPDDRESSPEKTAAMRKLPLVAGEDNSRSSEIRSSWSSKIATLVVPGDREPQSSVITNLVGGKEQRLRWKQKKAKGTWGR